MENFLKDKLFTALLILLAITLLSWQIFFSVEFEAKTLGVLLLVFAFVKVQIIISQYMELNRAALPIRVTFWLWTMAVAGISIGIYLR